MANIKSKRFTKDFTLQEPIGDEGIQKALEILKSGKLHRYNVDPGEKGEAALLEEEFAAYMGKKYCLACASCGSAMYLALKSVGVKPGDKVLCNAYTLAPVPGAIENTGAAIELVDIVDDYTIDLDDLEKKAAAPDARWFMLSHMRGHIANMDRLMDICAAHDIVLIEDCAHTMGASLEREKVRRLWNGRLLQHPDLQAHEFRRRGPARHRRPGSDRPRHHYTRVRTCSMNAIRQGPAWRSLRASRPWSPITPAAWTIFGRPF